MNLRFKSLIVGTPLEPIFLRLRWHLGAFHRYRFPEMREADLEQRRLSFVLQKIIPSRASNCVDVGCHIGSFLSLVLKLFPEGHHAAVEPSPTKARWLKDKFPTASIYNMAIADEPGLHIFEENTSRPGYSRLYSGGVRDPSNQYFEVEVTTLDLLFSNFGKVDLLKIDVEGGELEVLKGGVDLIRRDKPIILFEVGSEYALSEIGVSRRHIYDFLRSIDYDIFTFTDILFDKDPVEYSEFRKCGVWPFRAFNFIAKPHLAD